MSRLRLLKMLYIADRIVLQKTGRTITGDAVCALENGPVLTRVYDLIKGEDVRVVEWSPFIRNDGKRDLLLHADPGVGKLSRFEVQALADVAARFESNDDWEVADYTHSFPEWQKNRPARGSSRRIPFDDVLEAFDMLPLKDMLLSEAAAESATDQLLPGALR
ncbi:MAG TPA: Panacea domain-containing protein [Phycisphaerae bacterium]|nr:Panacea domain-containing protein [Phycisphaerae bacterium]